MTERKQRTRHRITFRFIGQLVLLVAGFALLLAGVNRGAEVASTTLVAENIQQATLADQRPYVELGGRLFLAQLVRGSYSEVFVVSRGVRSGTLRVEQIDSDLTDVRVSFHDVLFRDFRAIGVRKSEQRVTLLYTDLNNYFEDTGRLIVLSPGPENTVQLSGTVDIFGNEVEYSTQVSVSVRDSSLVLVPGAITTQGAKMTNAGQTLLLQRLRLTIPMTDLPFGHQLVSATPNDRGISVVANGESVVVRP